MIYIEPKKPMINTKEILDKLQDMELVRLGQEIITRKEALKRIFFYASYAFSSQCPFKGRECGKRPKSGCTCCPAGHFK